MPQEIKSSTTLDRELCLRLEVQFSSSKKFFSCTFVYFFHVTFRTELCAVYGNDFALDEYEAEKCWKLLFVFLFFARSQFLCLQVWI